MRDIKFVIKTIAKQKDLEEEVVKNIIDLYWAVVVEKIKSGKYTAIDIKNVGIFAPKHYAIMMEIKKRIRELRRTDPSTKVYVTRQNILRELLKIKNLTGPIFYERRNRINKTRLERAKTHN